MNWIARLLGIGERDVRPGPSVPAVSAAVRKYESSKRRAEATIRKANATTREMQRYPSYEQLWNIAPEPES